MRKRRYFWLSNAEPLGRLGLAQTLDGENIVDRVGEEKLCLLFLGVGIAEVGEYVTAALGDQCLGLFTRERRLRWGLPDPVEQYSVGTGWNRRRADYLIVRSIRHRERSEAI